MADESIRTPDVWWILLDGYARQDVLNVVLDFDNTPFTQELTDRGFRVSDDSYTSYPSTELAIPSVLELDHVLTSTPDGSDGWREMTESMRGRGRVVEALGTHGYRYLYADNGIYDVSQCDPSLVDVCIDTHPGPFQMGHLARTVADLTPLAELRSDVRPDPALAVQRAQDAMSDYQAEFLFAHVLNPHESLWYDDRCNFRSEPLLSNFSPERYVQQIGCLNPQILRAADAITETDPEAIVIIQSDHGSGFLGEWNNFSTTFDDWSSDALAERYSILEAMRFPDGCATPEGDHSNVATFEYVLACIEGRTPEVVEDRYFFWRTGAEQLLEIDQPVPVGSNE